MAPERPPAPRRRAAEQRYAEERAKRLRPDGNDQYVRLQRGHLAYYLDDPYTPVADRDPAIDDVDVAVIGAGFAGLLTGARLREAGLERIRLIDKGGDVGGTWYWNRYPGAQCDTASMVYLPLLEETGHVPTEKYVHAPEILEHCRRIARRFALYDDALLHTVVEELRWNEGRSRWEVTTDRSDRFTARFVTIGTGPLHVPKLPGIAGIESFAGHSFHTSRWDYDYTGGSADGAPIDRLADKRVGIIGTGATAVQCVPRLAAACAELYVFQRTPSSVDRRDNHPIDPEWFASIATPGWQRRWLENFTNNQTGVLVDEDLVHDGWTEIASRVRRRVAELPPADRTAEKMRAAFEEADFEKMDEIRARVDAIVADPATADQLKAWYRQLCKRPCFHDEYLQAFNRPNTHLVDTDGKGVARITPSGVVAAGQHYALDCIIYASGFEVGTEYTSRAGFEMIGRDGVTLSQRWADGMSTMHGMHVHGFPNAFWVQPVQGANLISNIPHNYTEAAATIAAIVAHLDATGHAAVEVTAEAEAAWMDLLLSGHGSLIGSPDCTPGYYNNEGRTGTNQAFFLGYPHGAAAYFRYLDEWRTSGDFEGLEFR